MQGFSVYIKCNRSVEIEAEDVYLKDLGSLWCTDHTVRAKLKSLKVHRFSEGKEKRCVISVLSLVEQMEKACPGISVQIVGETDVLVEQVNKKKEKKSTHCLKVVFVCLVSFFGTAFTIAAYHNDVGIHEVFTELYRIFMNREPQGLNVLEVSYSIGLALGICIFFNHIGPRRITKDPTPIEVAMRNYETDVDNTLIDLSERVGGEQEPLQ